MINYFAFMKNLLILFLVLFLTQNISNAKSNQNPAKSKLKTIKFHKAETEAEKALDRILMEEKDNNDNATQEYKNDLKRQLDKAENSEECKRDGDSSCYPWECNHLLCSQDKPNFGYEFLTLYEDKNIAYIAKIISYEDAKSNRWDLNNYRDSNNWLNSRSSYAMKKEDEKWKIDGICCQDIKINHEYCWNVFRTYLPPKLSQ
jgi:hypothetical protein